MHTLVRKLSFGCAMLGLALTAPAAPQPADHGATLQGSVQSDGSGLAGYADSLYASFADRGPSWKLLGSDTSNSAGNFLIKYSLPTGLVSDQQPILFVEAQRGPVMLASAIGIGDNAPLNIVVNVRTTIATGNAFAQFVQGRQVAGNVYGMTNAVGMAANLANPETGDVGVVLASTPNGTETSTLATFNSLANVVAGCVVDDANCAKLFKAATPVGEPAPANVLQAIANIVKYPAYPNYPNDADDPMFLLSQADPIYQPALASRPTSWLLFLKITGGFYSAQDSSNLMDGPGTFAITQKGLVWVDDNYEPQLPGRFTCAGRRLLEFEPSGAPAPGSPFFGGGLSGAGWGVTLDPNEDVWIGDFGFQDPPCALLPQAAPNDAVSEFMPDGRPISPSQGFTQGNISWPMGTVWARRGNLWIANCGNDTVTEFPGGDPNQAINI
jgi:hypothetical protein